MPGLAQFTGKIYPLTLYLALNPRWGLAYADDTAMVFTLDAGTPAPQLVYEHIVGLSRLLAGRADAGELAESVRLAKQLLKDPYEGLYRQQTKER